MSAATDTVLTDLADGVLTITLNRPERGNAWNSAMTLAYFDALEQAARDPAVRVILVTGAGKAFCTGGDGAVIGGIAAAGSMEAGLPDRPAGRRELPTWLALSIGKPVIAAINGACFGMGMQQALCCDIRFASEEAKFSTAYAKRGLIAEMGMSWLLQRLVGTGRGLDLMLSARLVRAAEAREMGLVEFLVPHDRLLDEARAYARTMVEGSSPRAMRMMKYQAWKDASRGLIASYDEAQTLLAEAFTCDDFREGFASWQEGRPPAFPPLADELAFFPLED